MLFRLVQTPAATQAQVVWSGRGEATDTLGRTFLDATRADPGPLTTPQEPLTVEEECALLGAAQMPTVLTAMPERDARERYSCAASLVVIVSD
jgi:hypothetical protein